MFWQYVFSNNSAQIEKLLQKEDVTLQELMEEEELLQECQAQNKKLIDFLCQDSVLRELVSLVVTEPNSDVEYQVRFKHASLAAEVLTAEVPTFVDKLGASEELLAMLCKFLNNEKPLNPLLASFFSKVLSMLLHRRSEQNWYQYQVTCSRVLDYLKCCPEFIPQLAQHIGTSAIMNLLHKLLCGVNEEQVRSRIHAWFRETPLISLLIGKLGPESDWCEQANVEQLLCDVLDSGGGGAGVCSGAVGVNGAPSTTSDNGATNSQDPGILPLIMNETVVSGLMNVLLHTNGTPSSISHSSNILLKMLTIRSCHAFMPYPPTQQEIATAAFVAASAEIHHNAYDASDGLCEVIEQPQQKQQDTSQQQDTSPQQQQQQQQDGATPTQSSPHQELEEESSAQLCVARAIADALPQIHDMMLTTIKDTVQTSYGSSVERVGSTRLRLISLVSSLIQTRHFHIHSKLAELETLPHILDLFFRFPQNNFLHSLVHRCITDLLSQPSPCRTPTSSHSPSQEVMETARTPTSSHSPSQEVMETARTPTSSHSPTQEVMDTTRTPHSLPQEVMETGNPPVDIQATSSEPHIPLSDAGSSLAPSIAPSSAPTHTPATLPQNSSLNDATPQPPAPSPSIFTTGSSDLNQDDSQTPSNVWNPATTVTPSPPPTAPGPAPEEGSHPLLCQLIKQAALMQRLLQAYNGSSHSDDDSSLPTPPVGYMGHVRLMANCLRDNSKAGPNAPLLALLLESVDEATTNAWQEFVNLRLAEDNALNEVLPIANESMLQITEDDLQTDSKDLIINAMTHSLSFDDNNGFDSSSSGGADGAEPRPASPEPGLEGPDAATPATDLFEKMCSDKFNKDLDNMWTDKEREITFAPSGGGEQDDKDIAERSSSDDEDEEDEGFRRVRPAGASNMEVDDMQDEWESLFDRRSSGGDLSPVAAAPVSPKTPTVSTPPAEFAGFNPWQSAPNSDTDDTSWASFGASAFGTANSAGPFGPSAASHEAFGRVNFDAATKFASSNPFEAFTKTTESPAKTDTADSVPFEALFPDNTKGDTSTGVSSGNPSETAAQNRMGAVEDGSGGASPQEDLATNYHFLSQLGVLKPGADSTDSPDSKKEGDKQDTASISKMEPPQSQQEPTPALDATSSTDTTAVVDSTKATSSVDSIPMTGAATAEQMEVDNVTVSAVEQQTVPCDGTTDSATDASSSTTHINADDA